MVLNCSPFWVAKNHPVHPRPRLLQSTRIDVEWQRGADLQSIACENRLPWSDCSGNEKGFAGFWANKNPEETAKIWFNGSLLWIVKINVKTFKDTTRTTTQCGRPLHPLVLTTCAKWRQHRNEDDLRVAKAKSDIASQCLVFTLSQVRAKSIYWPWVKTMPCIKLDEGMKNILTWESSNGQNRAEPLTLAPKKCFSWDVHLSRFDGPIDPLFYRFSPRNSLGSFNPKLAQLHHSSVLICSNYCQNYLMCSRSQMFLLSKPDSLESWPCNLDDYTPNVFQERAPSERFKLVHF